MIEQILSPNAVAASVRGELETELAASELATIRRAVAWRRRAFTTGRACARRALVRLGLGPTSIPTGPAGEPRWPAGVVGSITHCEGYRAAAVARTVDLGALAIDAEPNRPLPVGVLAAISTGEERARLQRHSETVEICPDRLLFSAKEAIFKLWFPLTGDKLGFEDADVELDLAAGTFHARLDLARPALEGRWLTDGDLIVTGICLSPEQSLQCSRDHEPDGRAEWQRRRRRSIPGDSRRPCGNR